MPDNAMVMLENISRHREKLGKSADMAAHEGADEVMSAITAGTLTNLAAQFAKIRFESGFNRTRVYRRFNALIDWLAEKYRNLLGGLIRWRWRVLAGGIGIFVASLALANELRQVQLRLQARPEDEAAQLALAELRRALIERIEINMNFDYLYAAAVYIEPLRQADGSPGTVRQFSRRLNELRSAVVE